MPTDFWSLAGAAVLIGGAHTLLGPDHYVPFVAMSRAGKWSVRKTMIVTWLCGLGHIAGSVLIGLLGIALGIAVSQLEGIEAIRGDLAGWLLVAFGLVYLVWGIVYSIRKQEHSHVHVHGDGTLHAHPHHHQGGHLHPHTDTAPAKPVRYTPWILFTVFLFGPCEPLIPLLMYPAAKGSIWGVVGVTFLFALATLVTMTAMVFLLVFGVKSLRFSALERYSHAIAGALVLGCGIAVTVGL